jgi:hypothetical protein
MITRADLGEIIAHAPKVGDWVLITPEKHGTPLFWRPKSAGYTSSLLAAGVYPEKEAKSICGGSHGETQMFRVGMDEPFLRALQRFEPPVFSELAALYEIASLRDELVNCEEY